MLLPIFDLEEKTVKSVITKVQIFGRLVIEFHSPRAPSFVWQHWRLDLIQLASGHAKTIPFHTELLPHKLQVTVGPLSSDIETLSSQRWSPKLKVCYLHANWK